MLCTSLEPVVLDMKRVDRVQRALRKGVSFNGFGFRSQKVLSFVGLGPRSLVLHLSGNRWAGIVDGEDAGGIDGGVGGFHRTSLRVVDALASFKMITRADAVEFGRWFHQELDRQTREGELENARRAAESQGYVLVKKEEGVRSWGRGSRKP